jgi:hypothetical protein
MSTAIIPTDSVWADLARRLRARPSSWWALAWLLAMVVQIVHTASVASTYHVGSFDDDGNYLMAAHVLASGGGLTAIMPSGARVVANYLPGYPLLLVPLIWAWGSALGPPRLLSALCTCALYPLLWVWLDRRGLKPGPRTAVLVLLALNTVLATYSTMVMAEAPFLLVLVLALLALERWERRPGWPWATVEVVLLAFLVWLKEAGIGLAVGLVAYELWRRRPRRAMGLGAGVGALLLPGLVARLVTGAAAVGDRYAGEISNTGNGGLAHVPHLVVSDIWAYGQSVLRQSVLPTGGQLPAHGPVHMLVVVVGVTVPVFSVVGSVAWYRRHPTGESWMVWAYFAETLFYAFTNQRRVILVLPVVVLWYVFGACVCGRALLALGGRSVSRAAVALSVVVAVLAAGVPTAAGFTQDYMYGAGQQSSQFVKSSAMALLKALGSPSSVVETDYRGSVAYFTDHRTAWTAFTATTPYGPFAADNRCSMPVVQSALAADDAKFLTVGEFNLPWLMDSPCLLHLVSTPRTAAALGAVRLLSIRLDQTSVFEFVGPGTSQPGLVDHTGTAPATPHQPVKLAPDGQGDTGGVAYRARARAGEADFDWAWPTPVTLSQVSVGLVTSTAPLRSVAVAIEVPGGKWDTIASTLGAVGAVGGGGAPYLLAEMPSGRHAVAIRVSAQTSGVAEVAEVAAIGP